MNPDAVRALLEAFQGERLFNGKQVKLLNPPTNCLSPIEEMLIKEFHQNHRFTVCDNDDKGS